MIDLRSYVDNAIFENSKVKVNWQTGDPRRGGLYIVTVQNDNGDKQIEVDSWNRDKKNWDTYRTSVKKVIAWFDFDEIIPYDK